MSPDVAAEPPWQEFTEAAAADKTGRVGASGGGRRLVWI